MNCRRLRIALAAGAACIALFHPPESVHADLLVFDPTNYAQNVLTAARELQQINNEIQSLENQATMLINQAKNLASLPYSAVAQLEASIQRTEQLLTQAQRIAYSVTTIDQAFTQVYPQSYSTSTSSAQLMADAGFTKAARLAGSAQAARPQSNAARFIATASPLSSIARRIAALDSGTKPD